MKLDHTNIRLIELLQQDARMTFSNLARILNRAESTVRERIMMLEQRGVIRGYRANVDQAKLGFPIRAMVQAECDLSAIPAVTQRLKSIPNIIRASVMTGANPVSIEIVAEDLAKLEQLIEKQLATVGLKSISVRLVLQTLVDDRPGPLETANPVLAPTREATPAASASLPAQPPLIRRTTGPLLDR
ncbi:MAG: Lrp/AsnC family transcriptional regulator [Euryarchaeota archaeon]|nr:Lrp/AsnC family transcriptional regulator [Euryarchaeota archaeon]